MLFFLYSFANLAFDDMRLQRIFLRLIRHFRRLFFPVVRYRLIIFLMLIFASISLLISLTSPQSAEATQIPDRGRTSKQHPTTSVKRIKRDSFSFLPELLKKNFTPAVTTTRRKSTFTTTPVDRKRLWNNNQTTVSNMNQSEGWIKSSLAL